MTAWKLTAAGEVTLRRISVLGTRKYQATDHDGIRATVISCTTLIEAHIDGAIKRLFASDVAMREPLTRILHQEVEDSIYRTWESRRKWLSSAFGINIAGDRAYQEFEAVIALRNALVHGDGRLTDLQISKVKDMFALAEKLTRVLGVQIDGRVAHLCPEVALKSAIVSKEFLLHFDAALLGTHPNFGLFP
ncbi:hypothetical protein ACFUJU_16870 [Streptomyces sp. NPDC057235]|uniref:hypothetical protein n=1 Tax=Streptomyces sp. NPDC057235 TaxID=3346058 RepID=UPI00363AAB49